MGEAALPQRYLKPKQAAQFLDVSPKELKALPDLLRCHVSPRLVRYDIKDLEAYRPKIGLPGRTPQRLAAFMRECIAKHGTPGFIYFMQCRELVKVGYSGNPASRRARLQAIIPFPLTLIGQVPGSIPAERAIHAGFASAKSGLLEEWFHASPSLLNAIAEVCNG